MANYEYDVFLSYSSKDIAIAERLDSKLSSGKYNVFRDKTGIEGGENYVEKLYEALGKTRFFVIILTSNSTKSRWVKEELSVAKDLELKNKLKIVPIYYEDCKFPKILSTTQYIDFRQSSEEGFNKLVGVLSPSKELPVAGNKTFKQHKDKSSKNVIMGEKGEKGSKAVTADITSKPVKGGKMNTGYVIGVDLGSSNIHTGIVDIAFGKRGRLLNKKCLPIRRKIFDDILKQLEELINEHMNFARGQGMEIKGIGMGLPGQVDSNAGVLRFAPGLHLFNSPFQSRLEERFDMDVLIDNDARCATRCELHWGAGSNQGINNFVCIFIGTGVGSGIVINKEIYSGKDDSAGEIGHMVIDHSGPECNCGNRGCLEAFVSAPAIIERAKGKITSYASKGQSTLLGVDPFKIDTRTISEAAQQDDPAAMEVIKEVANYLGIGLANYINIMNPDVIVLGGGVIKGFFSRFIKDISLTIRERALIGAAGVAIQETKYEEYGPVLGAALLFSEQER